jgi:hypothetical protein
MADTTVVYKRQGFVGTTANGEAVYVEVKVTSGAKEVQTITHGTASHVTRVSIAGHYYDKRSRRKDWSGGGQCVEMLDAVTRPAPGLAPHEIIRLAKIWQRWHLNDMRMACAHQEPVYHEDGQPDLGATPRCPETGYRCGSAWLYEAPPADVLDDLGRITLKLDGENGLRE